MGNSLQYLHAHDAILLLRHSFAIPKLLYVIWTAPCFISPSLKEYDAVLRSIVCTITNNNFEEEDTSWIQATLPIKFGGLGFRRAVQLAPSAYLASAARSADLIRHILPSRFQKATAPLRDEAIAI